MNSLILQKKYTLGEHNYQLKIPFNVDVFIPDNDCVRLISQFVEEMDLTELYETYERLPSEKYASPEIMLKIMLYAYREGNGTSSRTIEKNCRRDINYMYLLEGRQVPDHAAIARFRTSHFAPCAEKYMAQMTDMLAKLDQITDTEVFIDGTKIEANANKYTFVWKRATTKNQARFLRKTALLVGEIIERYEFKPLWNKVVKKKHVKKILKKLKEQARQEEFEFVSGRGHRKEQLQKDIEDLSAALAKIQEYETKLHKCGSRNSYSKTDEDATFMHMKDDHMMNGQLKPGYNVQHAVNSGYIVMVGLFQRPGDTMTLKPFWEQMEQSLSLKFKRVVADAGYDSEENLKFFEEKGIEAYIKPSDYEQKGAFWFLSAHNLMAYIKPSDYEQRGTKKLLSEIGHKSNMQYDREQDCYICHNGKKIVKVGERNHKTASGYARTETDYKCSECGGCPYRGKCMPGKNWKKPVEERFKSIAVSKEFERLREDVYGRINTDEGKKLRMNRSIQAEGSFADIKGDSKFTRYLCRGCENVYAESVLYAMAHNLGWLHTRIQEDKLDQHLYDLKESA